MEITVTYPDGKSQPDGRAGQPAFEALKARTAELKNVVAAKVDGRVVDLSRAAAGRWRAGRAGGGRFGARAWTSCATPPAHLMAQAVKRLFPGTQVTIGPVIEDGFFYDFKKRHTPSRRRISSASRRR